MYYLQMNNPTHNIYYIENLNKYYTLISRDDRYKRKKFNII